MSNIEKVKKKQPILKKQRTSVQQTMYSSKKDNEFLTDFKRNSSLSNSASFNFPVKQIEPQNLLTLPIQEIVPSNFGTTKSNRDFEDIEQEIQKNNGPLEFKLLNLSNDQKKLKANKRKKNKANLLNDSNSSGEKKKLKKKNFYKEELPEKLRVSRTEFEPSLRSNFTSIKKQENSENKINQKDTLSRTFINF